MRLLEAELAQARDAIAREQAELGRERGELARERCDNDRLRAENRALLNSLLGTAGIPPLEIGHAEARPAIAPIRRRSWPQISTAREIEAAREARAHERETSGA